MMYAVRLARVVSYPSPSTGTYVGSHPRHRGGPSVSARRSPRVRVLRGMFLETYARLKIGSYARGTGPRIDDLPSTASWPWVCDRSSGSLGGSLSASFDVLVVFANGCPEPERLTALELAL